MAEAPNPAKGVTGCGATGVVPNKGVAGFTASAVDGLLPSGDCKLGVGGTPNVNIEPDEVVVLAVLAGWPKVNSDAGAGAVAGFTSGFETSIVLFTGRGAKLGAEGAGTGDFAMSDSLTFEFELDSGPKAEKGEGTEGEPPKSPSCVDLVAHGSATVDAAP